MICGLRLLLRFTAGAEVGILSPVERLSMAYGMGLAKRTPTQKVANKKESSNITKLEKESPIFFKYANIKTLCKKKTTALAK